MAMTDTKDEDTIFPCEDMTDTALEEFGEYRIRTHMGHPVFDVSDAHWLRVGDFVAWAHCPWTPPAWEVGESQYSYLERCIDLIGSFHLELFCNAIGAAVQLADGWAFNVASKSWSPMEWVLLSNDRMVGELLRMS